ncbi:hypothetical protein ACFE04_028830 [Oxalis oulophora]
MHSHLCLYAWARGCPEAPEFLSDECLILRSAFGCLNVAYINSCCKLAMHNQLKFELQPLAARKTRKKCALRRVLQKKLMLICVPAICLHPGSGDYHVFFPETEGDALLVEVEDKKKSVQGRATIPVSSFTDNPNDRVRWWPIYYDDQECTGKIQLSIERAITSNEANLIKSEVVVETLACDLLLEASIRAQHFHTRTLRYLSHIMDVATPTKDCLELVNDLLVPILKAKSERNLTRQESYSKTRTICINLWSEMQADIKTHNCVCSARLAFEGSSREDNSLHPTEFLVHEKSASKPLGIFLNTIKRILDVLHCRVEDMLKSWASYLPAVGYKKALFREQMNGITMQANRYTRLKKILEEIREEDGEAQLAVDFGTNWDRLFRNFLKGGKKTKYGTMDCHALGVSDPLDTLLL